MGQENVDAIRKAIDDLNQVLQQVGTAAYQQAGPAAGAPGGDAGPDAGSAPGSGPTPGGGEDVVDGEFTNA